MDPIEKFTDEEIWAALETVSLKDYVTELPGGLQSDDGNFLYTLTICDPIKYNNRYRLDPLFWTNVSLNDIVINEIV